MSTPNLSIQVEPNIGGKAAYLPIAASASDQPAMVKIVLRLRIMNNEGSTVMVNGIQFSYPGSATPSQNMQGVGFVLIVDGAKAPSANIGAGQTATWSNGVVDLDPDPKKTNNINNAVYLPAPAPAKVKVSVSCANFSTAASVTLDLTPYAAPAAGGAYYFLFRAGDLRHGEFAVTSAQHWANGGAAGNQIFAHDISIQAVDNGTWGGLLPGGSKMKNEDYRIWGKPICAIADGVVEQWNDGIPTNTITADANGNLQFPNPTPAVLGGNNFWIRHTGDVLVLYAHMQPGTQPKDLQKKGAQVRAGQKLGLAGNSGNATNPHTHIHAAQGSIGGALRPLPFSHGWIIDQSRFKPPGPSDPWTRLTADGISQTASAIWPASTTPTFKVPAAGISRAGDWANSYWISPDLASFEKHAQDLFDKQGRRLIHVASFLENGHRRWAGIAQSGNWANSFWISADRASFEKHAQDLFDQQHLRLVHVSTHLEGNARRWVGIARSGDWANSFWISPDRASFEKHAQDLFDQQQRRLVHVTTYPEGNARRWIGIARSGDWANSFWISPDRASFEKHAQDLFDQQQRRLVHVTTYAEGNARRWIGVARSGDWANSFFIRGDLDSFNLEAQDLFDDKGRRLIVVDFLAD